MPGEPIQDPDLQAYLRAISRVPLLSAADEVRLGRLALAGSTDAIDKLVRANLRLVVHTARRWSRSALGLADLIAEGNLGLIHAATKFDPAAGCRFSTYATWWIRQAIGRAVQAQSPAVRVPSSMLENTARWERAQRLLEGRLHRPPTAQEVGAELKISLRSRRVLTQALRTQATGVASLSVENEGSRWSDSLPDPDTQGPLAAAEAAEERNLVLAGLDVLQARLRYVIEEHFGLGTRSARTLDDLGRELGVSRERVRQMVQQALGRMRHALAHPPRAA